MKIYYIYIIISMNIFKVTNYYKNKLYLNTVCFYNKQNEQYFNIYKNILCNHDDLLDYNNTVLDEYESISTEYTKISDISNSWKNAFYKTEKLINDIKKLSCNDTIKELCNCIEYIELPEKKTDHDQYLAGIITENNQHFISESESESESDTESDTDTDSEPELEPELLECPLININLSYLSKYNNNIIYNFYNLMNELKLYHNKNIDNEDFILYEIKNEINKCDICDNIIKVYATSSGYIINICYC